jgi:hypothetical protein
MKYTYLLIVALILGTTSCKENGKKFTVKQIEKNGLTSLSYVPQMPFVEIRDSSYYYFTQEDNIKIFSAEISRADIIARTDYYHVRVMLRKYLGVQNNKYEIMLRTFSLDGKILDTVILGSTLDDNICDGVFDGENTIVRTCNGKKETLIINDLGKIVPEK